MMDNNDFLLCTDDHGQPVVNEFGKLIYYCKKSIQKCYIQNFIILEDKIFKLKFFNEM